MKCRVLLAILVLTLFLTGCHKNPIDNTIIDFTEIRPEYSELSKILDNIAILQNNKEQNASQCPHLTIIYKNDFSNHWTFCSMCDTVIGEPEPHTPNPQLPISREIGVGNYNVFVKICATCNHQYEMILTEKNYTYVVELYGKEEH